MLVGGVVNDQKKRKCGKVKGKKKSTPTKPSRSSTNSKIEALDQKLSEQFSRLEAMLLARTLEKPQQEPPSD